MKLIEKYQKSSIQAKATIWFTMCGVILKGLSLISAPIFTRILVPDEYGKLAVYNSFEQLFVVLGTWEIMTGAYERGILKYEGDLKTFTSSLLIFTNLLSITVFGFVLVFSDLLYPLTGMNRYVLLSVFLFCLFRPAYNGWITKKRFEFKYKSSFFATILFALLSTFVPLIFLLVLEKTANVKFIATMLVGSAFFAYFYFSSIKLSSIKNIKKIIGFWKYGICFQLPLVLHSLSFLILNQSDRVMIKFFCGESPAAYYSVAYSLALVVSIFQQSFNQVLTPWRYKCFQSGEYKQIRKTSSIFLLIMGICVISFILVAPEIIKLLFSSSYYEAIWCIPPISMSVFFMFLYSMFVQVEQYYEKTKYVMIVSLACGLINIVLNFFAIKIFGYIACGYTTLISYILFAVGHYIFMQRVLNQHGVTTKTFDMKIIFLLSLFFLLLSLGITLLYPYLIIRYCIFTITILVIIFSRKRIKTLFEKLKEA